MGRREDGHRETHLLRLETQQANRGGVGLADHEVRRDRDGRLDHRLPAWRDHERGGLEADERGGQRGSDFGNQVGGFLSETARGRSKLFSSTKPDVARSPRRPDSRSSTRDPRNGIATGAGAAFGMSVLSAAESRPFKSARLLVVTTEYDARLNSSHRERTHSRPSAAPPGRN